MSAALEPAAVPTPKLVSPSGEELSVDKRSPKTPFWDPAPGKAFVQYHDPGPWESVQLAGVKLGGVCRVASGKARKVSRTAGPGDEQEQLTDTGAEASEVQIGVVMWMPWHLTAWEDLLEAVEMRGGTRSDPEALAVIHPGLNAAGIDSLYVIVITIPQRGASGTMEYSISATEFKPRALKGGGPKGSPSLIEMSTPPIPIANDPTKPSPRTTGAGP